MPHLSLDFLLSQVFWLILSFVTCYILSKLYLVPVIKSSINVRSFIIDSQRQKAKAINEEIRVINDKITLILEKVTSEAYQIKNTAITKSKDIQESQSIRLQNTVLHYTKEIDIEIEAKLKDFDSELPKLVHILKNEMIKILNTKKL